MAEQTDNQIISFDVYTADNYSRSDNQHDYSCSYPPTRAGLAGAMDRARIEAIEQRGCSGSGAGAWVEAVFDVDDEDLNIRIDDTDSPVLDDCSPLEIGASRLALARRAGRLERESVWDGHNHVTISAHATRRLIETV